MEAVSLARIARALSLSVPEGAGDVLARGVSIDTRTLRPGDIFFALPGERHDGASFVGEAFARGAVAAVAAESAPSAGPGRLIFRVKDARAALGAFARTYRSELPVRVVAVTGSAGKTTTKEMVFHMVSDQRRAVRSPKSFNNDVGVPLTLLLADRSTDVIVAEVGTSGPGEIDRLGALIQPDVAAITCVAAAHIDGLGDIDGVTREKASLLRHLRIGGMAVLNADDLRVRAMASALGTARGDDSYLTVGFSDNADVRGRVAATVQGDTAGSLVHMVEGPKFFVPVPGYHNARNALMALAVCRALGLDLDRAAASLRTFAPPEGRFHMETIAGVTLIDDTYNANPASVTAALETFAGLGDPRGRVVVLGGMLELGKEARSHHQAIGRWVARIGIERLVTVGEDARWIAEGALRAGLAPGRMRHAERPEEALAALRPTLRPGTSILFKGSRRCGLEAAVKVVRDRLEADRRDGSGERKRPISGTGRRPGVSGSGSRPRPAA
jgi:UDP-N-acetylmuramoyl-tripeptide--D-alanyl-D-alanine ligase